MPRAYSARIVRQILHRLSGACVGLDADEPAARRVSPLDDSRAPLVITRAAWSGMLPGGYRQTFGLGPGDRMPQLAGPRSTAGRWRCGRR